MAKLWAGLSAGLLAGAAGATAKNAVSYLDQAVQNDSSTTSPAGRSVTEVAGETGVATSAARKSALGPLGGLAIGVGVGAVAGAIRGSNATPPPVLAGALTGLVAMGIGEGAAVATGTAKPGWASPVNLLRDLVPHLAYGAVTGWALHRMVDPRTSVVSRFGS